MTSSIPSTSEQAFLREAAESELGQVIRQSAIQERVTVRKNSSVAGTASPNTSIIFRCGNAGDILDLSAAVFRWSNLQVTTTVGVQARLVNGGAWAIVKSVIVRAGENTLATVQNVNVYVTSRYNLRAAPYSSAGEAHGIATAAQRQVFATQARSYELPLNLIFPDLINWPQAYGLLEFEIQLCGDIEPLEATGASTSTWSFNGSTSYLQFDVLKMKRPFSIPRAIRFQTYKVSSGQIAAGTNNVDVVLAHRLHNMRALIFVERVNATVNLITTLNRNEDFVMNARSGHQAQCDSTFYPPFPVRYTAVDFYEGYKSSVLLNAPAGDHISGSHPSTGSVEDLTIITPQMWGGVHLSGVSKNIVCISFDRSDSQASSAGILSGINTKFAGTDTRLQLEYTAGATSTTDYSCFVVADSVLRRNGDHLALEE